MGLTPVARYLGVLLWTVEDDIVEVNATAGDTHLGDEVRRQKLIWTPR